MRLPPAAVIVSLGLTQTVGYGTLYYAFSVLAPVMAADLGLTEAQVFGAFSLALLAGALGAPRAGALVDRFGARIVLAGGSALAAASLAALSRAGGLGGLAATLVLVQAAGVLALYDVAFAAVGQSFDPGRARRAITQMTLIAGFASTVFWPLTGWLLGALGWRDIVLIYALANLVLCLPLHLALPPRRDPFDLPAGGGATGPAPAFAPLPEAEHPRAMRLLVVSFALTGFVFGAMTAAWVPVLTALGMDTAAAVAAGTLMGPAQVAVRVLDMRFGVALHPVRTAAISALLLAGALAVLLVGGGTAPSAFAFAAVFGLAQGLTSIVRGAVPLALFGPRGYGARLGRLARPRMIAAALAPFAVSAAIAVLLPALTLTALLGLALVAAGALLRLRPPAPVR